jgi:hypothetical protein
MWGPWIYLQSHSRPNILDISVAGPFRAKSSKHSNVSEQRILSSLSMKSTRSAEGSMVIHRVPSWRCWIPSRIQHSWITSMLLVLCDSRLNSLVCVVWTYQLICPVSFSCARQTILTPSLRPSSIVWKSWKLVATSQKKNLSSPINTSHHKPRLHLVLKTRILSSILRPLMSSSSITAEKVVFVI